jgi:hypothetical protein
MNLPEGRVDTPDRLLFVLASLKSTPDEDLVIEKTAEFCQVDIPVAAKLVCDFSLGDYRADLASYVAERFSQPDPEE